MLLYNLGAVRWQEANGLTSALVTMGREGIVLARPQPPPLCVGDLVNIDRVVNLNFCRAHRIPIVKSQSHTRALCLAQTQLELRMVLRRGHPLLMHEGTENLRMGLAPLLETCRGLDIEAEYKAPNEIVVRGRRIAQACLSERNSSTIISASLAIEFDAALFADMLNAPDENMRARLVELIRERRTSMFQQLHAVPPGDMLEQKVCAHLRRTVQGVQPGVMDDMRTTRRDSAPELREPAHAQQFDGAGDGWNVDIGAGTELQQRTCKAPGGFLRADCEWHNGRIVNVLLTGDFLCHPPGCLQRLEEALVGVSVGQLAAKVCDFYCEYGWVTPGVQPGHWARVLLPLSLENYQAAQPS